MSNYSKNLIYLSDAQYQALVTDGSITVDNTTITYNEDDIYVTPQAEPYIKPINGIPASDLASGVVSVQDVQIDGTSILSNGIANIPLALPNSPGLFVGVSGGIYMSPTSGKIQTNMATESQIKAGTNNNNVTVPSNQHQTIYYGLSKLAGADLASETVTVGTYPDTSKAAINTLIGSISKVNLDNAGITAKSYTTKFGGEFTVTTATTSGWNSPYKRASVTGRINKEYLHRVTINNTEYILPTRLWYSATNGNIKVYEYLGNLGLYISSTTGVPGGIDNVPFVIISDLNNSNSIDVLTQIAGTYTIKVEQIEVTQKALPKSLIWEDAYVPIEKSNNGGTYNGFNLGVNELTNKRGTFALGYGNKINSEFGIALGEANVLSAPSSYVEGSGNQITSSSGVSHSNHAEGYLNNFSKLTIANHIEGATNSGTAVSMCLHVEGFGNVVNGSLCHVEGGMNEVNSGTISHIEGTGNISNSDYIHVQGTYNVAETVFSDWVANTSYTVGDCINKSYTAKDVPYGPLMCIEANSDSTFTASKWKAYPASSDTAMLIGNGTANNARSNALKIDWLGNARFMGNVYVGCNADSTGGTRLPHDVQVNGTSVMSNGVANVPVADASTFGAVKVNGDSFAIGINSNGVLIGKYASIDNSKSGTTNSRYISPYSQHAAAFYGIAKAAGVDMASSNNAVGTYTSEAKAAIQTMLGVPGDVQINGTSIVSNGVANIQSASYSNAGVVKTNTDYGTSMLSGYLYVYPAQEADIKAGTREYRPIGPARQHISTFYGLAKAAGDTTIASSSNVVGIYTAEAKAAIQSMLGVETSVSLVETVSGTTPSITGVPNTIYECGELSTLSITPPANGTIGVYFTSGSTATVLTVPNTVKFPAWFDATALDVNTIYEIMITNGVYGSVMTWAS